LLNFINIHGVLHALTPHPLCRGTPNSCESTRQGVDKCIIFAWSKTVRIIFSSLDICQWRKSRSSSSSRMLSSSRFACTCRSCSGFISCTSGTFIPPSPVSLLRAKHCMRHTASRILQAQVSRQAVHLQNASRAVSGPHPVPWQQHREDRDDYAIIDNAYS
jgi:hypothetical protein